MILIANREVPESILENILTAEEYSRIEHETPYVFELKAANKELYYFGSPHTSDPQNPLFTKIERALNIANPDIVFVEGMHIRNDRNIFNEKIKLASREEIIKRMGESGFALQLALQKSIEWHSPEPSDENLYNAFLAKGFSKEEIFAWDIFQMLPQYQRQVKQESFGKYVQPYIDQFKRATLWETFDYSYEHAIRTGEKICGAPIDVENDADAADRVDPIPWQNKQDTQTILNRISEASSLIRDRNIVTNIIETFKTRNRIFVVYGSSHAAMQEPALRKLFSFLRNQNTAE